MNTGGPAFPTTLLDWFAGQALVGILSDPRTRGEPEEFATAAYNFATAMLAEKARREGAVKESQTTDHFPDATKKVELEQVNKELVEFAERLAAFPLEEFGWQSRKDSQPIHGWNDYTLYVSDIKRARNLVAKAKEAKR